MQDDLPRDLTDDELTARLAALDAKIKQAKHAPQETSAPEDGHAQAQLAWRMVIELVAGIGIGFGIGYGIDTLAGTKPIFLVIFIFLGLAAGVKTMMRSAQEVQEKGTRAGAADGKDETHG